jgi:drug/metabolite transporter (DMT)-like permease
MLLTGIAFGLLASLALGLGDLAAGLLARHVGVFRGTFATLTTSFVLLAGALWLSQEPMPDDATWIAWIAGVSLLRVVGYLALVRAFSLGPVSLVAPIAASSGVVTVLASVLVLGDRPSAIQWVAVGLGAAGAVLVSLNLDQAGQRFRVGRGPLFALIAMVLLANVVALQQPPIRDIGWLPTITIRRGFEVLMTGIVLILVWRLAPRFLEIGRSPAEEAAIGPESGLPVDPPQSSPSAEPSPKQTRAGLAKRVAFVGIADSVGLGGLAVALAVAPAWLFGISGSLAPLPGMAYGMLVFRERLRPTQWLGIGAVVVALFLVAVG